MRRPAAGIAAVLMVIAVLIAGALLARPSDEAPPPDVGRPAEGSPSPVTSSPTSSPTPSPTVTPEPTRFVNTEVGYSIDLPPPWRRSDCGSGVIRRGDVVETNDVFVVVSEYEEGGSDLGLHHDHVQVFSRPNPEGLSPRKWYEAGKMPQSVADEPTDVTFADRLALRLSPEHYAVANGDRMFEISGVPTVDGTTSQQDRIAIIESFRFLTSEEIAAARAAPSPSPTPRSPEEVADVLAEGFARKDVALLATVITDDCITLGFDQSGGIAMSEERYLDELRERFAAGLVVIVRPQPLTGERTGDLPTVYAQSTWRRPGEPDLEVDLMISPERGEQWAWRGTLTYPMGRR